MSPDRARWFLVNASPDLPAQLATSPELQSPDERGSRVESVLITNADLDHVLGLFLLREGGAVNVQATAAVRETLVDGLRLDAVLGAFGGIRWSSHEETSQPLLDRTGAPVGISCRAIDLPGGGPPYAPASSHVSGHSVALEFTDETSGRRLLVAPDLAAVTPAFTGALAAADAVLIDGTFWDEEELGRVRPGARRATEMGHLPIHAGTLELMHAAPARFKAYVHINNTNPILRPGSAERAAVGQAGVVVPDDGWEFTL